MRILLLASAGLCLAQTPTLKLVRGSPFSAQAITQTTQRLADGNHIVHQSTATIARDSEGRTRREDASIVLIQDPVAGAAYILEPKGVRKLETTHAEGAEASPAADAQSESLGSQLIEGVQTEGTRLTRTVPAGQSGNERPITVTMETWYSSELQTIVLSKSVDPRVGETTYRLTNIQRTEPPRSLFEPGTRPLGGRPR